MNEKQDGTGGRDGWVLKDRRKGNEVGVTKVLFALV
jgi:hypothetical protein